jgi:hypothetical protein
MEGESVLKLEDERKAARGDRPRHHVGLSSSTETVGTTRAVVVTVRNYGIDNRATIDAIAPLGKDARSVAVLR